VCAISATPNLKNSGFFWLLNKIKKWDG
jgi:hypothetical protein